MNADGNNFLEPDIEILQPKVGLSSFRFAPESERTTRLCPSESMQI